MKQNSQGSSNNLKKSQDEKQDLPIQAVIQSPFHQIQSQEQQQPANNVFEMAIDQEGTGQEENRNEGIPDELPDNRKTKAGGMF